MSFYLTRYKHYAFCYCPTVSGSLFNTFPSFPTLFCSHWIISIDLFSGFLILFSVISILLLNPYREVFWGSGGAELCVEAVVFSSSKISIWFYFISTSLLILAILKLISGFRIIHLSIFIIAALKSYFPSHLLMVLSHVIWEFCNSSYGNMDCILNILNVLIKSCAFFKSMENIDIIVLPDTQFH